MQELLIYVGGGLALFVAGVVLSTKIKDWFAGVPASLRTELNALEASVKAQVTGAQKVVVAAVKAKVIVPTPALQTAASTAVGTAVAQAAVAAATGTTGTNPVVV